MSASRHLYLEGCAEQSTTILEGSLLLLKCSEGLCSSLNKESTESTASLPAPVDVSTLPTGGNNYARSQGQNVSWP